MLRRLLPNTLLGRALLIVVTPLLVMQLLSAWVFYESHWDQISKRLSLALAGEIVLLVDALGAVSDPATVAWMIEDAQRRLDLQVTIEPDGILPNAPPTQTAIEGELRRALVSKQIDKPVRVDERSHPGSIVVSVQLPRGVLTAAAPTSRLSSWTTVAFVLWNAGMALILLGVATLFMRNQVRPVRRLARVADEFGKGRDVPEFRPQGAHEVRQAGIAFIAMRNRIQRQITQRTAMLAGVSHDLRTPLTRMKLELEMMRRSAAVNELKEDVHEMERMLDGYLAFARGEGQETPEPCDLGRLLADAVRQARRQGGQVDLACDGDLTLPLRPHAFRRCLSNLLDNALRYARHVAVSGKRRGRVIEVIVDDDGPGIPAEQREEVFKPFHRMDGSRNPATGGVGLGLTIARDVVRGHGGDILLDQSPDGGLRVRVRLPV
jgi:two-component system, OmpR family, osmolarity sensor histidine kinase EnvZ